MRIALALAGLAVATGGAATASADPQGGPPSLQGGPPSLQRPSDPCCAERNTELVGAAVEPSLQRPPDPSDPCCAADRYQSAQVGSKGLSLEQIRNVMRANAAAFNACLTAATRHGKQLHGPFLYDIEVDKKGKVTSVRPFQPSPVASFDKCIIGVLKRAKFPGGPASIEAPIVFDPS